MYGIPFHAWDFKFFELFSKPFGLYLCVNDDTRDQKRVDMTRIMIRTRCSMVINDIFNVSINGSLFTVKVVEDLHEPLSIFIPTLKKAVMDSSRSEADS